MVIDIGNLEIDFGGGVTIDEDAIREGSVAGDVDLRQNTGVDGMEGGLDGVAGDEAQDGGDDVGAAGGGAPDVGAAGLEGEESGWGGGAGEET